MIYTHFETLTYVVLACFVVIFNRKLVVKDLSTLQANNNSKNDQFILITVKLWSVIFLMVMAASLLWTKQYLSLRQLNTFLVISLSGLFVDQFSLGGYIFTSISSLSWYELLSMFLETPSGFSLDKFKEPKWLLGFYLITSVAIAGHLQEKSKVLRIETSHFQFACVALVWSSAPLLHTICKYFLPELLPLISSWSDVPTRLKDLECGAYHRVITLFSMGLMHFCTRQLILSVDESDLQPLSTLKKNDENCRDIPTEKFNNSAQHSAGEESGPDEGADSQQLPEDAVEVSEEEALKLCQGGAANLTQRYHAKNNVD